MPVGNGIDLSDLDPLLSPERGATSSPNKIFGRPLSSSLTSSLPSSSVQAGPTLPAPSQLPVEHVKTGQDPLNELLGLGGPSRAEQTSLNSLSPPPHPPPLAPLQHVVDAQNERNDRIWNDLNRDPFQSTTTTMSSWSSKPISQEPSTADSASEPRPITRRRSSIRSRQPSSTGHTSFSPPRRLSGLMDTAFGSSPPTHTATASASSRPQLDPFHPSVSPSGEHPSAEDNFRRIRRASIDKVPRARSNSSEWGDFHSALSDATAVKDESERRQPQQSHTLPPLLSSSWSSLKDKVFFDKHAHPHEPAQRSQSYPSHQDRYGSRSPDTVQPIQLLGVRPGVQRALDDDVAESIRPSLPPRVRICNKWTLLYSLDQHGTSIGTMYERMRFASRTGTGGIVIVVKDHKGAVFGAYSNEALKDSQHYYGDGTCFLWKATPFSETDFRVGSSVKAFKWTGKNDYLVLTETSYLSFGGGDGKHGLWVDGVFENGFTTKCPAFDNEPLTPKETWTISPGTGVEESKFEVMMFECWSIML
ncbi:hypothetical protein ACM66B_003506 [Microbotryomycetes sp. NB124-2]